MCYNYSTLILLVCMFLLANFISQTPISYAETVDKVLVRFRFKVHIVNGFPDNTHPLEIRCSSVDDDLGYHSLWKDQEFRFEFKINPWGTEFDCGFVWGPKSLPDISVFRTNAETQTCKQTGNCFWKATPDGLYFSNHLGDWQKKYAW